MFKEFLPVSLMAEAVFNKRTDGCSICKRMKWQQRPENTKTHHTTIVFNYHACMHVVAEYIKKSGWDRGIGIGGKPFFHVIVEYSNNRIAV